MLPYRLKPMRRQFSRTIKNPPIGNKCNADKFRSKSISGILLRRGGSAKWAKQEKMNLFQEFPFTFWLPESTNCILLFSLVFQVQKGCCYSALVIHRIEIWRGIQYGFVAPSSQYDFRAIPKPKWFSGHFGQLQWF